MDQEYKDVLNWIEKLEAALDDHYETLTEDDPNGYYVYAQIQTLRAANSCIIASFGSPEYVPTILDGAKQYIDAAQASYRKAGK